MRTMGSGLAGDGHQISWLGNEGVTQNVDGGKRVRGWVGGCDGRITDYDSS